jgi:hypothetical protein
VHRAPALAAALLALSACRVERTPDAYLNPRDAAQVERRETENEIAARVGAFSEALGRGAQADAVAALLPEADTHVIGVGFNDGRPRFGPLGLAAALGELNLPRGAVGRTPDLRVEADGREGMAWFATHLEVLPVVGAGGQAQRLRVSGAFTRREGEWRLAQVHLSRAETPAPTPRPDSLPQPDSQPPNPASGAAPPAGE